MGSEPRVSIVVPFHSSYTHHLAECLASVRQQGFAAWELILVDDASPDMGWHSIVEDLAEPRIRVL
jgi:glycosyltransferase involved in cell wall biosynthesis